MFMKCRLAVAAALCSVSVDAYALPPIEAYGELPSVRGLDISPSGNRFAYLSSENGVDYFMIAEPGKGVIAGGSTGDIKARSIFFVNDRYAIVIASETTSTNFFKGKWENSAAFSFDTEKKRFTTLLRGFDQLYPGQSGLGQIVGRVDGQDAVFMPAYVGVYGETPEFGLLKARLNLSDATVEAKGTQSTIDWFVDGRGVILGRVDYDGDADEYRVFTGKHGAMRKIYQESTALPETSVVGVHPDGAGMVLSKSVGDDEYASLSKLGFDGSVTGSLFENPAASIDGVLTDGNRVVIGVRYAGMRPSYAFFDSSLTADMEMLASMFPDDAVYLTGWTEDFTKLVIGVEGGATAPADFLYDRGKKQLGKLAQSYAAIGDKDINPVVTIEYKARDGLKIPSILTVPRGSTLGQTSPLIVIPHGGPEAYDAVGFDWLAQYFASRGYLVLQPNFRGSYGFGRAHREAGHGEWGGKMQDDITDGVNLLIKKQWADPNRVCIIGGSYGGYAALAGGAFTPDLYKCVAAIAPVTDLNWMLTLEKRQSGGDSAVYEYWKKLIGDKSKDKAKIEAISPSNAAANFKAPVLLIHGFDDTVVPIGQSIRMENELKKAGKQVTFIKQKSGDHWLSTSETRLQTLRELDRFVASTIGKPN
jgi:dipeptidyl aminopeptidase/acylaminoacyl peptidase